ncbi:MAG: hypothetical protein RLZZ272_875 [Actinomycetota bacterium]|jgi:hypothetical protein
MDVLQTWIVVGVPAVLTALVLLVGRDRQRALAGLGVLAGLSVVFLLVPGGRASAALVGLVAVGLVAAGTGQVPAAPTEGA